MKILVTGGLGFIGHHVVARLESFGHDIVITDNLTTYGIIPQQELKDLVAERKTLIKTDRIYRIDIVDKDSIDWLIKQHDPDVVIHLASFPRQKVVNADPQAGSQAMSEGLLNLLEATSKRSDRRFVYISSSMVYGNFKDTYFDGVNESHTTNPIGQYGIMKLAGEWLVRDYTRRTGISHVILRPSAVYGPKDVEDRVVSRFLITAMAGGEIQVNGQEESLDFTYVTDAADGIAKAAVSKNTHNRTYNITRGHARSLIEAAELAITLVGRGSIDVRLPDANFPSRGQLNMQRAHQDFDYTPQVDIEQGFELYYEWLKDSVYGIKEAV